MTAPVFFGCKATIISTTSAVVLGRTGANSARLYRITINAALTGTLVVAGFVDETGAAKNYTLPAASVGSYDFYGAINEAGSLTLTASNAGDDDKVIAFWDSAT